MVLVGKHEVKRQLGRDVDTDDRIMNLGEIRCESVRWIHKALVE